MLTLTCPIRNGTPSRMCGNGSEVSKDNVAQVERATRLRTKRGNRQAGWQLVARPTRLRTKRGNHQAGQQLITGPTRLRTKRGNRQATRVRTGLPLRCGVPADSGVMAVHTSAGRPPAGFFLFRRLARPACSSASSASLICAAG